MFFDVGAAGGEELFKSNCDEATGNGAFPALSDVPSEDSAAAFAEGDRGSVAMGCGAVDAAVEDDIPWPFALADCAVSADGSVALRSLGVCAASIRIVVFFRSGYLLTDILEEGVLGAGGGVLWIGRKERLAPSSERGPGHVVCVAPEHVRGEPTATLLSRADFGCFLVVEIAV
jgi:hypothetical protein